MTASSVLVVRPKCFGWSPEAAVSNVFQHDPGRDVAHVARAELDAAVATLRAAGVDVVVEEDTPDPPKADAVFPNNWLSTHGDRVLLYPMAVASRRAERRADIAERLCARLGATLVDLSGLEAEGAYVEGTGSLVFDHAARVAFAALSPRTTARGVDAACEVLGYTAVTFAIEHRQRPVYHTNVVLSISPEVAVVADGTPAGIVDRITSRNILTISADQVDAFCGNVLRVAGVTVMSRTAFDAFTPAQRERLAPCVPLDIPTIERVGGGSARCLLAEIFTQDDVRR